MRSYFFETAHSKKLAEKEMSQAKFSGFTRRNKCEKKHAPFVMTHYASPNKVGRIIKENLCV